jgi:hypothetical protein
MIPVSKGIDTYIPTNDAAILANDAVILAKAFSFNTYPLILTAAVTFAAVIAIRF